MITNLTVTQVNNSNIVGRDKEIMNVIETLLRVEKPNVILTGEAGVGKTALVRHLAYLIANNLVPEELQGYSLSEVNLNDLIAGDGYRGVFERKTADLINQAISKGKVIIFMDEVHVAENLGKMQNGQTPGFGNMLKPHLTRSDIRVIGATTNEEYNKIEDKAFLRRFRRIMVGEPSKEVIMRIIDNCIERYNIRNTPIKDNKLEEKIYNLSTTFSGYNPDKVVDITDILFAKARINNVSKLTASIINDYLEQIRETKEIQISKSATQL